jgi:hypothetical protein
MPMRPAVGGGLPLRGDRVVVVLLADAVATDKDLVALGKRGRRSEVGLRLLRGCPGAIERRAIQGGIDLVERPSRLDVGALGELALEHDAVHTRAHLCHQKGRGASRQIGRHRHRLTMHGEHRYFGRPRRRRRLLRLYAGAQEHGQAEPCNSLQLLIHVKPLGR